MQVCIPVTEDRGLQSPISEHFGSTPIFLVVDTDSQKTQAIMNSNQEHKPGRCSPLKSLVGQQLDLMIVGGIGGGAFNALKSVGIDVMLSKHATAAEALEAYAAGSLSPIDKSKLCGHHGHGHGHGGGGGGGCGHKH